MKWTEDNTSFSKIPYSSFSVKMHLCTHRHSSHMQLFFRGYIKSQYNNTHNVIPVHFYCYKSTVLAAGGASGEAYCISWLQFSVCEVAAVQPDSAHSCASAQTAPCTVQWLSHPGLRLCAALHSGTWCISSTRLQTESQLIHLVYEMIKTNENHWVSLANCGKWRIIDAL